MNVPVREQVLAAFETLLGSVAARTPASAITVFRGRRAAVPEDALPALVMRGLPASSNQLSAGVVRNVERITVLACAMDPTDAGLDQALAALWAGFQRALETDPTLGGIAVDSRMLDVPETAPGIAPEAADQPGPGGDGTGGDAGGGGTARLVATVAVEYWTRPGDPCAPAP